MGIEPTCDAPHRTMVLKTLEGTSPSSTPVMTVATAAQSRPNETAQSKYRGDIPENQERAWNTRSNGVTWNDTNR